MLAYSVRPNRPKVYFTNNVLLVAMAVGGNEGGHGKVFFGLCASNYVLHD